MYRNLALFAVILLGALFASPADAACTTEAEQTTNDSIIVTGSCTEADEILFTTFSLTRWSFCFVMSTTGAVSVEASIDGTNFSTAIAIINYSAVDTTPVLLTTPDAMYAFPVKFRAVRLRQNGATDTEASLMCGAQ